MEEVRELNPNYPTKNRRGAQRIFTRGESAPDVCGDYPRQAKLYITSNKSAKYNKEPVQSTIFDMLGISGGKHV